LIVNKIDLVSQEAVEKVEESVKALNERAVIVESERCEIDTRILFGVGREGEAKKHRLHKVEFEYFEYVTDGALRHDKFTAFLEKIPKEIYRGKGFVKTDRGCYLMNYVAGRHTLEKFDSERNELVFIGKGALAQKHKIQDALDSIRIVI
jgi:G3E family GTPase